MSDTAAPPRITDRDACLAWLDGLGLVQETRFHDALHTVEEAQAARTGWGTAWVEGGHCKNLFLKDKKGALFLIVTLETTELKLNSLSKPLGTARLSFGNAELMWEVLGVRPGSVTPFALVNDTQTRVTVILDKSMLEYERLHYHPLENTATTAISREGLLQMLRATGHEPFIADLTTPANDE